MRITLDLPVATFRQLKSLAAKRGLTVTQVLRSAVERETGVRPGATQRRRIKVPILKSKQPGALNLTNAEIERFLA